MEAILPSRTLINGVATVPIVNQVGGQVMINGVGIGGIQTDKVLYLPGYPGSGNTIYDRSGNNNHGTLTAGVTWTRLNSGLWGLTRGGTGAVTITGSSFDLGVRRSATFMGWLQWNGVYAILIADYADSKGMSLRINSVNDWVFYVYPNNHRITYAFASVVNEWYHIAGVMDGDNMYLYKNGVQVGSALLGEDIGDGTDLTFGSTANTVFALGSIYTGALSSTQIAGHFNQERSLFGV
jgi:hypothetical protein